MTAPSVGLIIVAAGASQRMGGIDKVWALIGDRPMIWHSLERLGAAAHRIVVVTRPDGVERMCRFIRHTNSSADVVSGGATRQESVARGLAALSDVEVVAVHDCARPFAAAAVIDRGVSLLERYEGAIPVIPMRDTVKRVLPDGRVAETVDRATLRAVQTPQVFRAASLRTAHDVGREQGATDDASLLEARGMSVVTFHGLERNFKVTTAEDLELARRFELAARSAG